MASYKTILAVDDEPHILEPVKAYLEKQGYGVFAASSGKEALALLGRGGIDLVLLDLMLPDMTGEAVCRKIRETSRIPVIMLTAKVAEDAQLAGLGMGADDYLTKPFSLKLLAARIETVLRRLPESEPPTLFADKDLTATERKLLNALSSRPSRVFTRDELIDVAFDDAFDGYDRVIDTHIKNLRRKIGAGYVKTVHGLGYRWGGAVGCSG
ncbi:MAG: response regulator transcription factor [Lachnospiraceae bacterium]|jgi:DNA-binding response OmpR family regulator|nr:response regulator transcription factor [Lachnospiraceae bacterium]